MYNKGKEVGKGVRMKGGKRGRLAKKKLGKEERGMIGKER